MTSYQCALEELPDSLSPFWHVLLPFHSFVGPALSGHSECFDTQMMYAGKRHGVGFTAFCCLFCFIFKWLSQQQPPPLLSSASKETITLCKHKVQQRWRDCVCGKLCCVDLVCIRISFTQLLRLVSVLRDELRCFSLLVSACSALQ